MKQYQEPDFNVVKFDVADVIATSIDIDEGVRGENETPIG